MSDRFQALAVFRRVARCGSFSRAGRELGLSQSSVSRIVADLEREIGASLLTRTTRAVTLTEVGADYLARADAILDALDEADHLARGGGALKGSLRIALSTSFGVREVVPRLPVFMERHPELRIDLAVSDSLQDLVTEGIDIAFRLGALSDSSFLARRLGSAPRVLAAAPSYLELHPPITKPQDLASHAFIVGPGIVPQTLEFRRCSLRVPVRVAGRITCAANEGATAAARAGLGLTVSSLWGVKREFDSGELVHVLPQWTMPPVQLHAVFPPGRAVSPAARAFAGYFAGVLEKDSQAPDG